MLTWSFKNFSVYMLLGQQNFVQYLDNIKLWQDDVIKCSYTPHIPSPTSTAKRHLHVLPLIWTTQKHSVYLLPSMPDSAFIFFIKPLFLHKVNKKKISMLYYNPRITSHIPYESIQVHLNHKQFLIQCTKCKKNLWLETQFPQQAVIKSTYKADPIWLLFNKWPHKNVTYGYHFKLITCYYIPGLKKIPVLLYSNSSTTLLISRSTDIYF